jgi:unsaturated rhamnogalacturonyl hydrolase
MKPALVESSVEKKFVAILGGDPVSIALRAFDKHVETHPLGHYTGIVSLHGLARLGLSLKERAGDDAVLRKAQLHFGPFLRGEETFESNFPNYRVGGNGAAFLWWRGELPGATEATFAPYIDELMTKAPRDRNGVFCMPGCPEKEMIWIDVAFAVTPFLLFCGLKLNREDCIDEAWAQTRKLVETLRDPANGLVNQAINIRGAGHRTSDHWSRGNGWAILALTELAQYFPESHPARAEVVAMYCDLVEACLRVQDPVGGLWHQEMTEFGSYVETSGSGLILYAIGAGIECGLLQEARYREALGKGLRGLIAYIALDGSVHNTCMGCLSPEDGSKEAYMRRWHNLNDPHAFGPLVLAYGAAGSIGVGNCHDSRA